MMHKKQMDDQEESYIHYIHMGENISIGCFSSPIVAIYQQHATKSMCFFDASGICVFYSFLIPLLLITTRTK